MRTGRETAVAVQYLAHQGQAVDRSRARHDLVLRSAGRDDALGLPPPEDAARRERSRVVLYSSMGYLQTNGMRI